MCCLRVGGGKFYNKLNSLATVITEVVLREKTPLLPDWPHPTSYLTSLCFWLTTILELTCLSLWLSICQTFRLASHQDVCLFFLPHRAEWQHPSVRLKSPNMIFSRSFLASCCLFWWSCFKNSLNHYIKHFCVPCWLAAWLAVWFCCHLSIFLSLLAYLSVCLESTVADSTAIKQLVKCHLLTNPMNWSELNC